MHPWHRQIIICQNFRILTPTRSSLSRHLPAYTKIVNSCIFSAGTARRLPYFVPSDKILYHNSLYNGRTILKRNIHESGGMIYIQIWRYLDARNKFPGAYGDEPSPVEARQHVPDNPTRSLISATQSIRSDAKIWHLAAIAMPSFFRFACILACGYQGTANSNLASPACPTIQTIHMVCPDVC